MREEGKEQRPVLGCRDTRLWVTETPRLLVASFAYVYTYIYIYIYVYTCVFIFICLFVIIPSHKKDCCCGRRPCNGKRRRRAPQGKSLVAGLGFGFDGVSMVPIRTSCLGCRTDMA